MKCKAYFQTFAVAARVVETALALGKEDAIIKQTDGGYRVEWTSFERKDRPC